LATFCLWCCFGDTSRFLLIEFLLRSPYHHKQHLLLNQQMMLKSILVNFSFNQGKSSMTHSIRVADDFSIPATPQTVARTVEALRARGIQVTLVDTRAEALAQIHKLIPVGASVMTGKSQTLEAIGLEMQFKNKAHPWINLKEGIVVEPDPVKQMQMRVKASLAPWYLGSVQAIAETGEVLIASGSGSQLAAYAFTSPNLIWVAGIQKIVPTLADGLRRIREYSLPLEHIRMQKLGYPGAMLSKILIIEHETDRYGRKVNLILVNEPVGA
jgi:hypothetical protein